MGVPALIDETSRAASERFARFDIDLDMDDTNDWGWLDVTHTLTYTDALRWAWSVDPTPEVVARAVPCGVVRAMDRATRREGCVRRRSPPMSPTTPRRSSPRSFRVTPSRRSPRSTATKALVNRWKPRWAGQPQRTTAWRRSWWPTPSRPRRPRSWRAARWGKPRRSRPHGGSGPLPGLAETGALRVPSHAGGDLVHRGPQQGRDLGRRGIAPRHERVPPAWPSSG